MKCSDAIAVMHGYLDEDVDVRDVSELKSHLAACSSCRQMLGQLERTEANLRVPQKLVVPAGLKESIMQHIPRSAKQNRRMPRLKLHPLSIAACAILLMVVAHYTFRVYSDQEMVVQGTLDQLFISGDTVVVPAGVTVVGNLKVKRGKIQIDGNVEGDVTVIDGSYNLASSAYISGRVTIIDETMDWVWYKIKNIFTNFKSKKAGLQSPSFGEGSLFGYY